MSVYATSQHISPSGSGFMPLIPKVPPQLSKMLIDFSDNDCLSLSKHIKLREGALKYLDRYGAFCPASRTFAGDLDCYEKIEQKLAAITGFQDALIFATGYQLDLTVIPSLFSARNTVVVDSGAHTSLIEGLKLSRCRFTRFSHLDIQSLSVKIQEVKSNSIFDRVSLDLWIMAESVYGADGALEDLNSIASMARMWGAKTLIDDSHAVGVLGEGGMGLAACRNDVNLATGSFSNALGAYGAYLLCTKAVKKQLLNLCPGIVDTAALPPMILGAVEAALDIVPEMSNERRSILETADAFEAAVKSYGYDTGRSSSYIVSILFELDVEASALCQYLANCGFLAQAVRARAHDKDCFGVRFTMSLARTKEEVAELLEALKKYRSHAQIDFGVDDNY